MRQVQFTELRDRAFDLGFNTLGMIPAQPGRRLQAYFDWIEKQQHGEMAYLARPDRLSRRRDLNVILPGVQSIICLGLDYYTQRMPAQIATGRNIK